MLNHQIHSSLTHKRTMFYSMNTGNYCSSHAFVSMGMSSSKKIVILGRLHNFFDFFNGEVSVLSVFCCTQHSTCCCNFNGVSSVLVSLSYRFTSIFGAIYDTFCRSWITHQILTYARSRVSMTTGRANRFSCGENTRPIY